MKYATKLDYTIDTSCLADATITPYRSFARLQRYIQGIPADYEALAESGFSARNKSISNEDLLIQQLPPQLLALERPYVLYLEIPAYDGPSPVLPAHRDFGKKCSINVYLETNEETTVFYKWNRDLQISEYEEEFCSATGDVWLMNTDAPHSVLLKQNRARRMITICFAKSRYEEVLACFKNN